MARLKLRIVAQNSAGDAQGGATVKFYEPGTGSIAGASTTGTPLAHNLYTGISGGSPVSTTRTADSSGQVVVWIDPLAAGESGRCDVGIESPGVVGVYAHDEFQLDPGDAALATSLTDMATKTGAETLTNKTLTSPTIATPTVTGQALFAAGTAAAPGIAFADDPGSGLRRPADNQIAIRANNAVEWLFDGNATPAGPRSYIVDAAGTKSTLTLTRGDGPSGVAADSTYTGALMVTSFHAGGGGGEGIKASAYAVGPQTSDGFHAGGSFTAETPSSGTWTGTGVSLHGIIGVHAQATGYRDATRLWGGNIIAIQAANAASALTGLEIDVESRSGATVQDRYGLMIVTASLGANGGSGEDIAFKIANKNATEANRWKVGIGFHSPYGAAGSDGWPIRSDGVLMKAWGTGIGAADGIDLSAVAFSGNSIKVPGFVVKGNGRVSVNTETQTAEAPLYIDATGEAYPLRIDGFTVQTTVGAAGGASALPATPSGYIELRRGSTTYKIPLYAS